MPYNPTDLASAVAAQDRAATSQNPQQRLVAGPGTGKSRTIEQRVGWLLSQQGVSPDRIAAVSFTRASAQDLRDRIREYGTQNHVPGTDDVSVSTLHSLGLRVLRLAGLLSQYPVDPIVLDDWETRNIFDAEFSEVSSFSLSRCDDIRRHNEAHWQTGSYNPPNFIPPTPPITAAEQQAFQQFHAARTQLYSCVLPGEIIRQCVEAVRAGTLLVNSRVQLGYLIVDEFQDLNPLDLEFVGYFIQGGVHVLAAGDDDQSIYSFRFAAPQGIQNFCTQYAGADDHTLVHCFRYGDNILNAAETLMNRFPVPNRLPKALQSMYRNSTPPVPGDVFRWQFASAENEAHAIAENCSRLVAAGMEPREILILLSNSRALSHLIERELAGLNLPFEPINRISFRDTDAGRVLRALLRIILNPNDYVGLRVLLGELRGVGLGTCNSVSESAIANGLNYRSLFYDPLPGGVFSGRNLRALERAREVCSALVGWGDEDTIANRLADIQNLIRTYFATTCEQECTTFLSTLLQEMTLAELFSYLSADTDEHINRVMRDVYGRLERAVPSEGFVPSRIRLMTMHGSKGLSARVVFIPGLEDEIFPGPRRQPYAGLVLEGARLLYVAITRARLACFLSFSERRMINGRRQRVTPSRYARHTAGAFATYTVPISTAQATAIVAAANHL